MLAINWPLRLRYVSLRQLARVTGKSGATIWNWKKRDIILPPFIIFLMSQESGIPMGDLLVEKEIRDRRQP